jgi:DNA helicase-2/ATP-dependent DNA helicase PcrA
MRLLRDAGIPIYNPRSRAAHKEARFRELVGALSSILDPDATYDAMRLPSSVLKYIDQARAAYDEVVADGAFPALEAYVNRSIQAIRRAPYDGSKRDNYLVRQGSRRVTTSSLLFKLLGHRPFADELTHSDVAERLKMVNLVLADYESLYSDGMLRVTRDSAGETAIHAWTLRDFYSVFVEGIHDGVNDPEDEEVTIQEGMVNVMTIHQSKGPEFEVVFVLRPDKHKDPDATHVLEDLLDPFARRPVKPPVRRTREQRADEDTVRMYFVAYSRAKRLLVLVGAHTEDWDCALGRASDGSQINSVPGLQRQGVVLL